MSFTEQELVKSVQRMSTRDAVWLMKASMLPGVWTTINYPLMGWHMEHYGLIESRQGLARPTALGRRAAEVYCEISGLEV